MAQYTYYMTKPNQKTLLTYALNLDGKLVHVDQVSTGLSCKCFCPHCNSELVAKNGGRIKSHHFAHANGSDCPGAIESALHKMAKDILHEHKLIMLPPDRTNRKGKQVSFDKVEVEVFDKELSLRPDCIGYTMNGNPIWVEFKRTHEVDAKKAGKIISAKLDCIEIDLNSCELNPTAVKHFIESNDDNRIWIYNYENRHQPKSDDNYYHETNDPPRHIAIDEQNTIIDLHNLDEIDTFKHTYYCIACGKEVFINVDNSGYSFSHLKENPLCSKASYLHNAAKMMLCKKFNTEPKFNIYINQKYFCENNNECSFFNKSDCFESIPTPYDLKTLGYDSCEIDYKFPNNDVCYDIVLKRGDDLEKAIVIRTNSDSSSNSFYTNSADLYKNRVILATINSERDIFELYEKPLSEYRGITFFNFGNGNFKTTSREGIRRRMLKFMLFSSGKYHLENTFCDSLISKRSTVYEMITPNVITPNATYEVEYSQKIRQYAVLQCFNKHKKVCLCEICSYLKPVNSIYYHENICIRYKTKGTPKYPLATMQCNCPYFKLDKNLLSELQRLKLNIIEKEYNPQ